MAAWSARVRLGTRVIDLEIDEVGRISDEVVEIIVADAITAGMVVPLTPTGPDVEVAADDPASLVAWVARELGIVEELSPAPWADDDPRTALPEGAVG